MQSFRVARPDMNRTFFLHRSPAHPRGRVFADIPKGRVALIGEPTVGESMIIVPEGGGVVQTSTVRSIERSAEGLVVRTSNSVYRFTSARPATADAA